MKKYLVITGLIGCVVFGLSQAQDSPTQYKPLEPGAPAPDFEAMTEDGKPMRLSDYKGKIILLDIWSTWCVPCNKAFPHMDALHKQVKDQNVAVLALCTDSKPAWFEKWRTLNKGKFAFTVLRDPKVVMGGSNADTFKELPTWIARKLYPVTGLPTTYIIKDDKIYARPRGIDGVADSLASLGVKVDKEALKSDDPSKEGVPVLN